MGVGEQVVDEQLLELAQRRRVVGSGETLRCLVHLDVGYHNTTPPTNRAVS
jgi:hypothetical protein